MEADFSGYATKAGLVCSDGLTIMPNAFEHQDNEKVPLVWQHGHKDPENVLGHCILENRLDGVYAYGFFNKTNKAQHAQSLLEHKDITMMSIWANELVARSKKVVHGAIREVSLVLAAANPGAVIEHVAIRHSDDSESVLDDEAIIYTGIPIQESLSHSDEEEEKEKKSVKHATKNGNSSDDDDEDDDETIQDIVDTFTPKQLTVVHYLVGEAIASAGSGSVQQDSMYEYEDDDTNDDTKGSSMKHNVFETKDEDKKEKLVLSHDDMKQIVADATKTGSFKDAVENYAISHGIEDIDILFPDAKAISTTPELFGRRVEWVNVLLNAVRKSPFSRIKTLSADITVESARAKGYIKGTLKKEEFFKVSKRVTTPTTIYKKQKLDRDDLLDITDFDTVTWLKGEMRLMLDEELARAVLVGDGREASDEDKIDEERIRPIASDHELYTTVVNVNVGDANSSFNEVIDAITRNRSALRGTGLPTMFTTESEIANVMTLRDTLGRKIYRTIDELAQEIRVSSIVPVEILEEYPDIVAILVNPVDYVLGADKGGQVAMFDDFDIDYNQYKYLIETRVCGALVKLKSAMVVKRVAGNAVLVSPATPGFDGDAITITDQTGVVYRNAATDAQMTAAGSPYPVADGQTVTVNAEPASGYYFATSDDDSWSFTGTP